MFKAISDLIAERMRNSRPVTVEVNGDSYAVTCDGTLGVVVRKPAPLEMPTLETKTLSGFIDAVAADVDGFSGDSVLVQVVAYDEVRLVSVKPNEFGQRHVYLRARNAEAVQFPFGTYMVPEEFLLKLQSGFLPTENLISIQRVASGLRSESIVSTADDGLSQLVEVKQGASTVVSVPLPPRIDLFAYRTFREIDPTSGEFLLRLKAEPNKLPTIALIDVTADKWKYDTMQLVASKLRSQLPDKLRVIA